MFVVYLLAAAVALAALSGSLLLLSESVSLGRRILSLRRHPFSLARIGAAPQAVAVTELISEAEWLGYGKVNWEILRVAGGLAGVALAWGILGDPYMAMIGLVGAFVPGMIRGFWSEQVRWRHLLEIRDLIASLRMAVSLGNTFSQAFLEIAALWRARPTGLFGQRLAYHVGTKLRGGPEQVLRALALDFRSRELEDVLLRMEASRQGGLDPQEAIRISSEETESSMRETLETDIEKAPTSLIVPILVGLFPPIIILVLYPIANAFLVALGATTR
jgi:hypothetical protein